MTKLSGLIICSILLSACSTVVPREALEMNSDELEEIDTQLLCKALLTPDLPEHLVYKTAVPGELAKRNLNKISCLDKLIIVHGQESFCDGYNEAVFQGRNSAHIAYFVDSTKIHREDLRKYFELNDIECNTGDYATNKRRAISNAKNIRKMSESITNALLHATD